MSFLTIFSAPKPFTNPHIATIQRNAIESWLHLAEDVDVVLVGEEAGLAEAAAKAKVPLLSQVARTASGTPLVSSIFNLARQHSQSPLLGYVNADMLFLPDLIQAARTVASQSEKFLIIGQRWDLDQPTLLDFSNGWENRLRADIRQRGRLHTPSGSDYFIFPRALFAEMPDFAIGRAGWDNWMIYFARHQGWPVVDGTPSILAIHQDHDYSHLPGGQPHYNHAESRQNEILAGGSNKLFMVLDSDRQLRNGQIRSPKPTLLRVLRQAEVGLNPPDGRPNQLKKSLARQARRLRRRISGTL
ncbi:MAG TPA: hypothetical protein VN363_09940 [Anaerolineales bacterium]|nr:hypothetical protein [Anaerolineales bacterium]